MPCPLLLDQCHPFRIRSHRLDPVLLVYCAVLQTVPRSLDRVPDLVLARMNEATFKAGYPRWQEFDEIRARYYAIGKFASRQSRRLGLQ